MFPFRWSYNSINKSRSTFFFLLFSRKWTPCHFRNKKISLSTFSVFFKRVYECNIFVIKLKLRIFIHKIIYNMLIYDIFFLLFFFLVSKYNVQKFRRYSKHGANVYNYFFIFPDIVFVIENMITFVWIIKCNLYTKEHLEIISMCSNSRIANKCLSIAQFHKYQTKIFNR